MSGETRGRGWEETASMIKEAIYINLVIMESLTLEWQMVRATPVFHANLLIMRISCWWRNSALKPHVLLAWEILSDPRFSNLFHGPSLKRRYYSVVRQLGFLRDSFKSCLLCTCQYRGTGELIINDAFLLRTVSFPMQNKVIQLPRYILVGEFCFHL